MHNRNVALNTVILLYSAFSSNTRAVWFGLLFAIYRTSAGETRRRIRRFPIPFSAFSRRFSGKRGKGQGSGWWRQGSTRGTEWREFAAGSSLQGERLRAPRRGRRADSHGSRQCGSSLRSSRRARGREHRCSVRAACGSTAGALASRLRWRRASRRSSHAVARRARAALPASPRPSRRFARVAQAREFAPLVAAGAGPAGARHAWRRRARRSTTSKSTTYRESRAFAGNACVISATLLR